MAEQAFDAVATALRVFENAMPGVTFEAIDLGGGARSLRDYDLKLSDRDEPVAVEVTTATSRELLETRARFESQLSERISAPELRFSWHLIAEVGADVRRLRRELVAALTELEREWCAAAPPELTFFGPTSAAHSPAVRYLWQTLGIVWGHAYLPQENPFVFVSPPSDPREWTSADPGAFVTEAVQVEAAKQDNRLKLGESGRTERHLFVGVDPRSYPPWQDLDRGIVPTGPPRLPEEITTAWVGTVGSDGRDIAWRVTPPGLWEVVFP